MTGILPLFATHLRFDQKHSPVEIPLLKSVRFLRLEIICMLIYNMSKLLYILSINFITIIENKLHYSKFVRCNHAI